MKDEISAAVEFLSKILHKKNGNLAGDQITQFSNKLASILTKRFENHWHDQRPSKGQGYRCIRVHEHEARDPVLDQAVRCSGLRYEDLHLPADLTLWVDPREVSCRLGENRSASFCKVASFVDGSSENKATAVDLDRVLEEHEEARKTELNKFIQATSQRSNSPTESTNNYVPMNHTYHTVPYSNPSPTFVDGYCNGYYSGDTVYYPQTTVPTTTTTPSNTSPPTWGPKWTAPVASRLSPTDPQETPANMPSSSNKKNVKGANGKHRVKSAAGQQSHSGVTMANGNNNCPWVRTNHNTEVVKA